jgi:hypothetical protein
VRHFFRRKSQVKPEVEGGDPRVSEGAVCPTQITGRVIVLSLSIISAELTDHSLGLRIVPFRPPFPDQLF